MKTRPLLVSFLLVTGLVPAQTAQFGDFSYESSAAAITITRYTGPDGAVTVPDTVLGLPVISIGDLAFWGCTGLTSVTIPNSVTSIGDGAFSYCTALTGIAADALNPAYSSQDGVLFSKGQAILVQCAGGKAGSYTIPDSVTRIQDLAFWGCTSLTSVVIPDGVTSIGYMAFRGCTALTSVTIPNSVTSIGYNTFYGCTGLISITIPASVTSIGQGAFRGCTGLTRVFFEGNRPTIPDGLFADTPTTIYYRPGTPGWAATVSGRPTALWIPLTLGEAPPTTIGRLSLLTSSPPPATVTVQRSTNLRDWEDWQTISRDAGPRELRDPDASTVPCRFYRVVEE